jgi:beta propeller repeat protein
VITAAGDQKQPDIDGSRIVWQDSVNNGDIYGADITEPTVLTLVWPNGGQMLPAGSSQQVQWQSSGPVIDFVKIEFSADAGQSWDTLDPNAVNDGQWLWQPVPELDSDQCRLRISDPLKPATSDICDGDFTVFLCLPSLTADLNGDCRVDLADLVLFSRQWLDCGNPYDPHWCD